MLAICGLDCTKCPAADTCAGCAATDGHPCGGECVLASCCHANGYAACAECTANGCEIKRQLIEELNALNVADMPQVNELFALSAPMVNIEYTLPGGQKTKFWNDTDILLGTQLPKGDSGRFFGLASDGRYIMVCEYGDNGSDPEIVVFRKRNAE